MAASNAFVALSATFASGGIDGITDISASMNGTTVDLLTDAQTSIEAVFVDAAVADISITATDIGELASLIPGDTGSLVIVFQHRKEGRGAAVSGNKTGTCATAVLVGVSAAANTAGVGAATLTFRCSGPDSAAPLIWS